MNGDAIRAIGSLWPEFLIVAALIVGVIQRKPLGGLIDRLSNIVWRKTAEGAHEVHLESPLAVAEAGSNPATEAPAESGEFEAAAIIEETDAQPASPEQAARRTLFDAAFGQHDLMALESAFAALQLEELGEAEALKVNADYQFMRHVLGGAGAEAALEDLAENKEIASCAHRWIGYIRKDAGDFDGAIKAYELAAFTAEKPADLAAALVGLCESRYSATRDPSAGIEAARSALKIESEDERVRVLKAAASVFDDAGDMEMKAALLELALQVRPNDGDLLFAAAYAYSESAHPAAAVVRYLDELGYRPNSCLAANNLGVELRKLGAPLRAVKWYENARESGNTLATANLAYLLIDAGFAPQARDLIDEASATENPHENVAHAASRLETALSQEVKTISALRDAGGRERDFMRRYARAAVEEDQAHAFDGHWTGWASAPHLVMDGAGGNFAGEYEIEKKAKYRIKGTVRGRTAVALIEKCAWSTLWERFETYNKISDHVLLIVDGKTIEMLVPNKDAASAFVQLKREDGESAIA